MPKADLGAKKTALICPFNLDQLTGTPIRARTTIKAASLLGPISVIASGGEMEGVKIFKASGKAVSFSLRTIKFLIKERPIIVHSFTTLSVLPAVFYKVFFNWRAKIIFEMHGFAWFESKDLYNFVTRVALLCLDLLGFFGASSVIAMSYSQKRFLQKNLYRRKRIDVLWGPVDFDITFAKIPERDFVKACYLGNASFWQGLPFVIEAAKILLEKGSTIRFELAGFDPSDENRFPRYPNLSYIGKIPRQRVTAFVKDADVMLSPRIPSKVSELQYPHKLSEYLAAGRAIIASATNDERRIIDEGKCGMIVYPLNGDNLAKVLEDFTHLSYEKRNDLGKHASEYALTHVDFKIFQENLSRIYNDYIV